jgi:hypothetical protein
VRLKAGALRKRGEADMALIELHKTDEGGEDAGILFVNTDHIVAITAAQRATELQLADGHTRWVKNTPEEVVSLIKRSS